MSSIASSESESESSLLLALFFFFLLFFGFNKASTSPVKSSPENAACIRADPTRVPPFAYSSSNPISFILSALARNKDLPELYPGFVEFHILDLYKNSASRFSSSAPSSSSWSFPFPSLFFFFLLLLSFLDRGTLAEGIPAFFFPDFFTVFVISFPDPKFSSFPSLFPSPCSASTSLAANNSALEAPLLPTGLVGTMSEPCAL
mmetsp:Transcript_11916/g.24374  ORF Transcript_11916/g.24374 Transcript_11916/m.24374 type:complete len:203 (-) Transcript_11916:68-676(-)